MPGKMMGRNKGRPYSSIIDLRHLLRVDVNAQYLVPQSRQARR